jgi:hypothetical protein
MRKLFVLSYFLFFMSSKGSTILCKGCNRWMASGPFQQHLRYDKNIRCIDAHSARNARVDATEKELIAANRAKRRMRSCSSTTARKERKRTFEEEEGVEDELPIEYATSDGNLLAVADAEDGDADGADGDADGADGVDGAACDEADEEEAD